MKVFSDQFIEEVMTGIRTAQTREELDMWLAKMDCNCETCCGLIRDIREAWVPAKVN